MNGQLTCVASGNPAPSIELRKDGELNSITSGGNYNIEEFKINQFDTRLTLNIFNIQRQDDGLYYCMATNKIGKQDQIGHLQVEYKPDLSKTPLKVKTWLDRPINLTCIVQSIPNATVSWYFRNRRLTNGDLYQILNEDEFSNFKHGYNGLNYLKVTPRGQTQTIYGDYVCTAENKHGTDNAIINLSQAHLPSIREDPDLTNDSPNSILIKFNNNNMHDGGLTIKKMRVKYRERGELESYARQEVFPFDNDYILKGLTPRKTYYLSFSVENDVGPSDWTREYEKIMPRESAPDCPKFTYDQHRTTNTIPTTNLNNVNCEANLRPVDGDQPDRFDVKWLQPNDNGRPIELYKMEVYQVVRTYNQWNRIGDFKELPSLSNDQLIYHLTNLRSNTTYKIELRAKNSEGYSPASSLVFRTSSKSVSDASTIRDRVVEALTNFHVMIIVVLVSIVIALFILDIILYVRYDFGCLFCICHGCSSSERHRSVKKLKNSHSLNTAYSYHRSAVDDQIDPIMESNQKAEFKAELENRLIRLPKHSAV